MTANLERVRELLERIKRRGEECSCSGWTGPCGCGVGSGELADDALELLSPAQPPPEPARADWTRLARNAGWVSPEEQALAIRDATAPAEQLRVAVEALERIAGYCGAPGVLVCSDIASDALAKLRPATGRRVMLRDLLCLIGIHQEPDGLNKRWCWSWVCANCDDTRPGGLQVRRRRR